MDLLTKIQFSRNLDNRNPECTTVLKRISKTSFYHLTHPSPKREGYLGVFEIPLFYKSVVHSW